jgi:hypothetical protein
MAKRKKDSGISAAKLECDRLVEEAEESGKVRLNLFVQDEDWIAIEGDQASLAFLGQLLLTFAKEEGPGCLVFDNPGLPIFQKTSAGIYIYRKATAAEE